MGFTGNWRRGVWLGNDDGTLTQGITGGNLPTDVWHTSMKIVLQDQTLVHLRGPDGFPRQGEKSVAMAVGQLDRQRENAWCPQH